MMKRDQSKRKNYFFKKWAILGLFRLLLSFQTNITILTTNICEKFLFTFIQYTALGFKPTTLGYQVSSHNH